LSSKADIRNCRFIVYQINIGQKLENELIKNISQYIREFKLDYAIKLINLGERNIQYLADETGFNSFRIFLLVLRIIKVLLLPIISNLVDNNFSKVTF
jgi:AraC-like DNA-binding protein